MVTIVNVKLREENMTEKKQQILIYVKLFIACICVGLYSWGGMEYRLLLRRILAPAIAAVSCFAFSKNWKYLIMFPLLWLSSSIGYGASETWLKIIKRSYVALAFSLSCSLVNIFSKLWAMVVFHTIIISAGFVALGVFNPLSARAEETLLGCLIYIPLLLSTKPKEN